MLFQLQQTPLNLQSACVAHQLACRADDAMTGNHNGNGIAMIGTTHCPRCFGIAYFSGNLSVAARFPIGNLLQFLPYLFLKCCSLCL